MLRTYESREMFLAAIESAWPSANTPLDLKSALLHGVELADERLGQDQAESGVDSRDLRIGTWVIRDDDLPFLATLSTAAVAVATAACGSGIPWPAVIAAGGKVAELAWTAWRRGAQLTVEQAEVLGLLRTFGPQTVNDLTKLVAQRGSPKLSTAAIEIVVSSLSQVRLRSGDTIALALQDHRGQWRAVG